MMLGISPIDQLVCRIQYGTTTYQGIYTGYSANRDGSKATVLLFALGNHSGVAYANLSSKDS